MKTNPVCFVKELFTAFQFTMNDGSVHIGYGLGTCDAFLTTDLDPSEYANIKEWTQLENTEIPNEVVIKPTVTVVAEVNEEVHDETFLEEEIIIEMDM